MVQGGRREIDRSFSFFSYQKLVKKREHEKKEDSKIENKHRCNPLRSICVFRAQFGLISARPCTIFYYYRLRDDQARDVSPEEIELNLSFV